MNLSSYWQTQSLNPPIPSKLLRMIQCYARRQQREGKEALEVKGRRVIATRQVLLGHYKKSATYEDGSRHGGTRSSVASSMMTCVEYCCIKVDSWARQLALVKVVIHHSASYQFMLKGRQLRSTNIVPNVIKRVRNVLRSCLRSTYTV